MVSNKEPCRMYRTTCLLAALSIVLLVLSCGCAANPPGGGSTTPTQTSTAGPGSATVLLSARGHAFNLTTITVPAGVPIVVEFANMDDGEPHNFALYTYASPPQTLFVGEVITGPAATTYRFVAPDTPGTYFFECDIHPQEMNGQFIVL